MTLTATGLYLVFVFIGSLLLTGLIRRYSIARAIVDIPNERSSHSRPTPRGGGLSITLFVLLTILVAYYLQLIPFSFMLALAGGGFLVAVIGWLDDHYDLPAGWRAAGYLAAAVWALYWVGDMGAIVPGGITVPANLLVSLIIVLALAWLTNLYNFMDGTDALAASEAITVGIFAGMLFLLAGERGLALISFAIATAAAGFLFWNRPPAKIFMGDVGSCCIGFLFGVLAILGEQTATVPVTVWIILLAVFICDATFTLLMRLIRREAWYRAHRSHAYQRIVQLGISHGRLAAMVAVLNLLVIWPFAWAAYRWHQASIYLTLIVISLMFLLWAGIQGHYYRRKMGQTG